MKIHKQVWAFFMNPLGIPFALVVLSSGMTTPNLFGQDEGFRTYELKSGSRLWLEGSATVGDFTCGTERIEGLAKLQAHSRQDCDSSLLREVGDEVHVSLLVKSFDCGNTAMNQDMYNAMKADSSPLIQYELVDASIIADSQAVDSSWTLKTRGKLTIAGVTRDVPMLVTILRLSPTRFRIVGSKALSMHEFAITPPTALWGIIEAHDELVVRFDLMAGVKSPRDIGRVKK